MLLISCTQMVKDRDKRNARGFLKVQCNSTAAAIVCNGHVIRDVCIVNSYIVQIRV